MTTQLSFSVDEHVDDETNKTVQYGTFSRDWSEEVELDELIDSLEACRISHKQSLLRARKLLLKFPDQLEIQNFIANRLWSLEMRDESTDVREKAYRQACALLPPSFKGQISWAEIDNRSFLRVAHGFLLGLMHRRDGKAAKALAKKLLAWCPADNLGVRMLMGDISLMTGDSQSAMKSYLKEAATSPAHWYQAGQIAFREGDFVSACTYVQADFPSGCHLLLSHHGVVHFRLHGKCHHDNAVRRRSQARALMACWYSISASASSDATATTENHSVRRTPWLGREAHVPATLGHRRSETPPPPG